jgi:hypothetical protein
MNKAKNMIKKLPSILIICSVLIGWQNDKLYAQDTAKAQAPEVKSLLSLQYHLVNNQLPYITAIAKTKTGKKLEPAPGVSVSIWLDSNANNSTFLGKIKTNSYGIASTSLNVNLAEQWKISPNHTFYASADSSGIFMPAETEISITRVKIEMDTVSDDESKSITVKVLKLVDSSWVPVPEAEVKLGVKRISGELPVGEEENYTTDSTGAFTAEFKRIDLPGDKNGRLVLVARIENNEELGSASAELHVPWGKYFERTSDFNRRSLWGTRDKAPVWLLVIAFSIIIAVWSVIVYLARQIFLIKKLGTNAG